MSEYSFRWVNHSKVKRYPQSFEVDSMFAGIGWDIAARELGLTVRGFDNDKFVCQTRAKLKMFTISEDISKITGIEKSRAKILLASPPCQPWSVSGSGNQDLMSIIHKIESGKALTAFKDFRTELMLEPLRWIIAKCEAGNPYTHIAFEQVPPALSVWYLYEPILKNYGYSVVTGKLSAEQYGTPQTRPRAILMAKYKQPVKFPEPTHSRYYASKYYVDPGKLPFISIAQALLNKDTASFKQEAGRNRKADNVVNYRQANEPSFTITTKTFRWIFETKALTATPIECAVLQGFARDIPWSGPILEVRKQIGNACPPPLARAIISELLT